MSHADYRRRLAHLETIAAGPDLLTLEELIAALPPMSAAVSAEHDALVSALEEGRVELPPIMPADPARGITDIDQAAWVLANLPSDMVDGPPGIGALIMVATFNRNAARYGVQRAWTMQPNRDRIEADARAVLT